MLKAINICIQRSGSPPLTLPDFRLDNNDKVLLLGPSGCGKTTLLSVLAGLLPPSRGTVLLNGQDFYTMPPRARDQVRGQNFGFIFQTLHLLPSLTLSQNIFLAADMAQVKPEEGRLNYLLQRLNLQDKAHRKPEALSQGEQQRTALARAVFLRPKIIVADEPTSALDDDNAAAVINLLEEHAQETGASLLIATHDSRITNRFKTIINLQDNVRDAA